jgi:PTS system mannose-specific IIA component
MIGVLVVSHGNLARELVAACEHIVGPQACFTSVALEADDDLDQATLEIARLARECNTGQGVIILTEMFGGTPSNLAMTLIDLADVEIVCGMNLPMLIKLSDVRATLPLAEAARLAAEAGKKYISVASDLLPKAP